ncbi:MAG TPA: DUF4328 domain-containing protein [Planctomycetota bacterium]|nr:DUF4328 domain-containing protein [Planctomycetota bacterium]
MLIEIGNGALYWYCLAEMGDVTALESAESYERVLGICHLVCLAGTAFTFIRWFRRAYENAAANGLQLRHSLGWAVGGWMVPLLNLVRPAQIAADMWRHAGQGGSRRSGLIGCWWTSFLIYSMACNAYVRLLANAKTDSQLTLALDAAMVSSALGVLAAIPAIVLVRRLTSLQARAEVAALADSFGGGGENDVGMRQVVGTECVACNRRIQAAIDAAVCPRCEVPLHRECLVDAACPRCGGSELLVGATGF